MNRTRTRTKPNRNMRSNRNSNRKNSKGNTDISKYISEGFDSELETYKSHNSFDDFSLDQRMVEQIKSKGYTIPTEIQDKAIQPIMEGRDLIGIAGTGTGKTAAFLIPIIHELHKNSKLNKALIVTPTRELATQIYDEFRSLTKGDRLFATCLIGGIPVHQSIRDLQRQNHIIIGTPGRLMDMSDRGHLNFSKYETFVLDEFDRMLDMGFVDAVKSIDSMMTNKNQTLLFSATMDKSIRNIVQSIAKDAIEVKASEGIRPSNAIHQQVMQVPGNKSKIDFLQDLMYEWKDEKIILFCATKRKVDQVHKKLFASNIKSDGIHGDKSQRAREVALRKFKTGKINVLIATDVVARGIDVNDVSLVVNYEIPHDYTDYIHRIGRTGRAGKTGKAITLID